MTDEKSPAPYGFVDLGDKIIVGSPHGEQVELSDELKRRVQDVAKRHGAWYEGTGGDIEPNKELAPQYRGSWDDAYSSGVKGYPVEYLSPMFSNVDVNKPHEVFEDPKRTIMSSLIANQDRMKYFKDRRYDEKALRDFLQQGSEGDVDFLKMSQLPATKENLNKFFRTGESLAWPENWQEYPHNLGKMAKKTEEGRNKYLLDAPPGVYFTGAGHIPELRSMKKDLKVIGGERAAYADGGVIQDALRLARRGYATDGSVEDPNPEHREFPIEIGSEKIISSDEDNAARLDVGDFQKKVNNRNPMQVYQKLNDLTQKEIGFVPSVEEGQKAYDFFSNKPINYQERIENLRSKGTSTVTDPEGRTGNPVFVAGTTPEGKNIPLTNSAQAALGSAIARITARNTENRGLRGVTHYDPSVEKELAKQGKTGQFISFQPGYTESGENNWEIPGDMTGMRSTNPDYWRKDAEDVFRQRMADQNTLAHEVGHALHNIGGVDLNSFKYKMPEDVRKEFTQMNTYRTSLGSGEDKPVPFMPKNGDHDAFYVTSPEEMFAEATRRYMANPTAFKRMYPSAAKYMRGFVNTNPKLNKLLMLAKNDEPRSVAQDGGIINDALRIAYDKGGKIERKTYEPIHGLKITPPAEELSAEPDIRDYQLKRHAHEFEGAEEPVAPRRPVVLDAPLLGGKHELGTLPYNYAPAVEKALNLAYGQKTLPLYFNRMTAPVAMALDAYEASRFVGRDPKDLKNYTGVPGLLMSAGKRTFPFIGVGAGAGASDLVAKDYLEEEDRHERADGGPLPMRFSYGQRYNRKSDRLDAPDSKGIGFRGPLSQGDGIVSEYSSDRDISYPSVYEGITPEDLGSVLMHERMSRPKYEGDDIISERLNKAQERIPFPRDVDDRAYEAASRRVARGRSPFYEPGKDRYPDWSPKQNWEKPAIMPEREEPLMYAKGGTMTKAKQFSRGGYDTESAPLPSKNIGRRSWETEVDRLRRIMEETSRDEDAYGVTPYKEGGYVDNKAVKNALRLAKEGKFRLHQTLARTGYASGGIADNAARRLIEEIDAMLPHRVDSYEDSYAKGGRAKAVAPSAPAVKPEPGSDAYWAEKDKIYAKPYKDRVNDPNDPMNYISPEEYQKGNMRYGEYVMANGGRAELASGGNSKTVASSKNQTQNPASGKATSSGANSGVSGQVDSGLVGSLDLQKLPQTLFDKTKGIWDTGSEQIKNWMPGLIGQEGGAAGWNAKASTSSAQGPFQFITETWNNQFARLFGDTLGIKASDLGKTVNGKYKTTTLGRIVSNLRKDTSAEGKALTMAMGLDFNQQNAKAITDAGLPLTQENVYSVHFSGSPRLALAAAKNPNAPASAGLNPRQLSANPWARKMTVGQIMTSFKNKLASEDRNSMGNAVIASYQKDREAGPRIDPGLAEAGKPKTQAEQVYQERLDAYNKNKAAYDKFQKEYNDWKSKTDVQLMFSGDGKLPWGWPDAPKPPPGLMDPGKPPTLQDVQKQIYDTFKPTGTTDQNLGVTLAGQGVGGNIAGTGMSNPGGNVIGGGQTGAILPTDSGTLFQPQGTGLPGSGPVSGTGVIPVNTAQISSYDPVMGQQTGLNYDPLTGIGVHSIMYGGSGQINYGGPGSVTGYNPSGITGYVAPTATNFTSGLTYGIPITGGLFKRGGVVKADKEDVDNALRLAKGGRRVNTRIDKDPSLDMSLKSGGGAWTRAEGKNPEGGLNEKGRRSLKAQGHDIKRPQPEGGPRRDSFCARMKGMKEKLTSAETANDPDSRINKSLRAWNCADGGEVWDKPRPKNLGDMESLSKSQKKSAKASAKAAGRPYPTLVDNMRAAQRKK